MRRIIFFMTISLLLSISALGRTKLSITKKTMQLGGTIQMPIKILKGQDAQIGFLISPEFNYFVGKSFALGLSPSVGRTNLSGNNSPWLFSLASTAKYYIDLGGGIYPYLGVKAGMDWQTKTQGVNFLLGARIGILVPLNNRVALEIGASLNFYFNKDGYIGAHIPIGYLGIAAFF